MMSFETLPRSRHASSSVNQRFVQWRNVAPVTIAPERPIVSFTFDHVPRSALVGAEILERLGYRGGFYISTARMGQRSDRTGDMIKPEDVPFLAGRGHEIGSMTHTYLDCVEATPQVAEADVIANRAFLRAAGLTEPQLSFAYPNGETNLAVKQWAANRFLVSRGRTPGINTRMIDRSQLRATLITSSDQDRARAKRLIGECARGKGWLVFYTHDVRSAPSPLGISLRHLVELVQMARDSGADILPLHAAATACGVATVAAKDVGPKRATGF